ncbi:hypothetical protein P5V15_009462 [Pogonomyrmex californicus]
MPLCLSHFFFSSFKRKEKTREKVKVEVRRRQYFVAHSSIRETGRGEIQRTRMHARLFLFVTLTRLRTSVLDRSEYEVCVIRKTGIFCFFRYVIHPFVKLKQRSHNDLF